MKGVQDSTAGGRKIYTKPVLVVKGDITKLTLSCTDKTYGTTDGFTFMGQPITSNCS